MDGVGGVQANALLDALGVGLGVTHHERGRFAVQGIGRVRVRQELGDEELEDVDKI